MEKHYHILLTGYYPNSETKGFQKGDYIGGVSRGTRKITLENAISQAKEMWKDWTSKFSGSMIQVWIHESDSYPPRVGPKDALFYADNFKGFKDGGKIAEGTPF